jgi:peptidoglycan/LPS O-acetylase OafA/YrhL
MGLAYKPELDGLRALAALAVVAFHARVFPAGFLGVDLFFVLSGYLITQLLVAERQRTGRIALAAFYSRRARRLMPALLVFLAVYVAVAPLLWPEIPRALHNLDAALAGLYLADFSAFLIDRPALLAHAWSLAVEWQFYLLWPLVVPLVLKRRRPATALLALWLAVTVARSLSRADWDMLNHSPLTHSTGLILGAACSLTSFRSRVLAPVGAGALVFTAIALPALPHPFTYGIPLAEVGAAMLLMGLQGSPIGSLLAAPPLRLIGLLSYSLYLWHYPIARYLEGRVDPWAALAITLPLSLALAAMSYALIERRFMRSAVSPARA